MLLLQDYYHLFLQQNLVIVFSYALTIAPFFHHTMHYTFFSMNMKQVILVVALLVFTACLLGCRKTTMVDP